MVLIKNVDFQIKLQGIWTSRSQQTGLILTYTFLLIALVHITTATPQCTIPDTGTLNCRLIIMTGRNDTLQKILLKDLDPDIIHGIKSVEILQSSIPVLNLTEFDMFPFLVNLSVTGAQVKKLVGTLSPQIRWLNLSLNNLLAVDDSIFSQNRKNSGLALDLSYNKLSNLSNSVFSLNLTSLWLKGNKFNCTWVITGLYKWYTDGNQEFLYEPDEGVCHLTGNFFGNLTVLGALKVKMSAVDECGKMKDENGCKCDLRTIYSLNKIPRQGYPITHSSKHGKVSYSLRLDCSYSSLEEFPKISPYVTELNVAYNRISDLSPLTNDPNYANLMELDARHNQICSIGLLSTSTFHDQFQLLLLQGNNITELHDYDISQFFAQHRSRLRGLGLGENAINCDCFTVTKLRPILIKYESVILDWKTIFCQKPNISVWELNYSDVCQSEEEPPTELHWFIIIGAEVVVILAVVVKVWYDQREFRRSGSLPLCSTWIPRLPCDFMLEGLKDNHHQSHVNGQK